MRRNTTKLRQFINTSTKKGTIWIFIKMKSFSSNKNKVKMNNNQNTLLFINKISSKKDLSQRMKTNKYEIWLLKIKWQVFYPLFKTNKRIKNK